MKNVISVITVTALSVQLYAQSVDEGVKMYKYERYETAKNILSSHADKNDKANYYLGLSYIGLGQLDEAEKVFNKKDHYYNDAGKARILYIKGQGEKAQSLLEGITDKAKRREWEKYQVAADAITYTKGGSTPLAISWYLTALDRQEKDASLHIGLGDVYLKLDSGGGNALQSYEKALELGTDNSLAHSRLGYLWYIAQQYEDALSEYNKAKDADPQNPLPYRDLANAYQKAGNYQRALENVETYLQHSDQSVDNKITYANILYEAGEFEKAETKMEELISEGHERPYMYRIIAYTAFESGDVQKAKNNMTTFFAKAKKDEYINNDYIYMAKIYGTLANDIKTAGLNELQAAGEPLDTYQATAEELEYRKIVNDNLAKIELDRDEHKAKIYKELADFFKDVRDYEKSAYYYEEIIGLKEYEATPIDYYYWGFWNFYAQDLTKSLHAFEQMEEKFPNEGSALYWQARVKAAQDPETKTDVAVKAYQKWLDFDVEGYTQADAEKTTAYQYITFYYYNHDDKENALKYAKKITDIDADNNFANQIINYFNQ